MAEVADLVHSVKCSLMEGLDARLRQRFRTQEEAADALSIEQPRLSHLRQGHADRFSVTWLILMAERIGVRVTVNVE